MLSVENTVKPVPTSEMMSEDVVFVVISQVEPLDRLCAHKLFVRV